VRLDHLRQPRRDHRVPILRNVLVAQSGLVGRVPESAHQLSQRRSGLRGQHRASVPKIMKTEIGPTGGLPSQ
jgi:hypothetical protein